MKFKSAVLTAGSGSVGGFTVAHNAGGMYFRGRRTPTDPASDKQTAIRNIFASLANHWGLTLTADQRAEWGVYAQNVTILDAFGDAIHISGFNHYIRSNTPRVQVGKSRIDDGPYEYNKGDFSNPTFGATESNQEISMAFDNEDGWANEDLAVMAIYVSRPQNATINFFKGPYRYAMTVGGDSVEAPASPKVFTAPFAFVEGNKLFTRVIVSRADGRLSASYRTFCLCAA